MHTTDFTGATPHVGEVYAIRTFRVNKAGQLLPVVTRNAAPWAPGVNTARCTKAAHAAPDPNCRCGFYAYGKPEYLELGQARFITAVIACSGRSQVGTKGLRSQQAKITAIWASQHVAADLFDRIAAQYPAARMYRNREAMLSEFPLSTLAAYDPVPRRRVGVLSKPAFRVPTAALAGAAPLNVVLDHQPLSWVPAYYLVGVAVILAPFILSRKQIVATVVGVLLLAWGVVLALSDPYRTALLPFPAALTLTAAFLGALFWWESRFKVVSISRARRQYIPRQ